MESIIFASHNQTYIDNDSEGDRVIKMYARLVARSADSLGTIGAPGMNPPRPSFSSCTTCIDECVMMAELDPETIIVTSTSYKAHISEQQQ